MMQLIAREDFCECTELYLIYLQGMILRPRKNLLAFNLFNTSTTTTPAPAAAATATATTTTTAAAATPATTTATTAVIDDYRLSF
jgi:hypothetical protein